MIYPNIGYVVVNVRVHVIDVSDKGDVVGLDHELIAYLVGLVMRRVVKQGVRIISFPLVCDGVNTAVGEYFKRIASRGETYGIADGGAPAIFIRKFHVSGGVGRIVVGHGPHAVLSHSREVEAVIDRAFYKMQGHVSTERVRLHPVLLNPHAVIFAACGPSVDIVLEMSALPPILFVVGRCRLECEYGVKFRQNTAIGITDGNMYGYCRVHGKTHGSPQSGIVIGFGVGQKGGIHKGPHIIRQGTSGITHTISTDIISSGPYPPAKKSWIFAIIEIRLGGRSS